MWGIKSRWRLLLLLQSWESAKPERAVQHLGNVRQLGLIWGMWGQVKFLDPETSITIRICKQQNICISHSFYFEGRVFFQNRHMIGMVILGYWSGEEGGGGQKKWKREKLKIEREENNIASWKVINEESTDQHL